MTASEGQATFRLREAGSPELRVESDLIRGPRVFVDGRPAERRRERGRPYWVVPLADGSERQLFLVGQFVGLRALVDGETYPVERRLSAWELVLAVLPIGVATLLAGRLGLLTGGFAVGLSFVVLHKPWSVALRVAACLGLMVVAVAVAAILAPYVG